MQSVVKKRSFDLHSFKEIEIVRGREKWYFTVNSLGEIWLILYRFPGGKWSLTDGCTWDTTDEPPSVDPPIPADVAAEAISKALESFVPSIVIPEEN